MAAMRRWRIVHPGLGFGKAPSEDRAILQIRIHGRGGQGVVTAAEMLSIAAFEQGRHAQAFPSFGSERTGAPVVSFLPDRRQADPLARADFRA
jgi:hypothetical protein